MSLRIQPSSLHGRIQIPSSKSHTMRALLFGLMGRGKTTICHPLISPDTLAMCKAIEQMGALVHLLPDRLEVMGVSGKPRAKARVINAANSGQVLRFIGALAALQEEPIVLTGDASIRTRRPVQPLISALNQLGARATANPLRIQGPMLPGRAILDGADSQPVSGLLIATSFLPGPTELHIENPGETPWIDLTLHWLQERGIRCVHENHTRYTVFGSAAVDGFRTTIPGDWSSAAFALGAALITPSELTLENLDSTDIQGDKEIISLLRQMGATIAIDAAKREVHVKGPQTLQGTYIDINRCIDALPLLAILGCFAEGKTKIVGAAIARCKESDRISAIAKELCKMGAHIKELRDGLEITPSPLRGTEVESHSDHRIALALAVAALAGKGATRLNGAACIAKSYPSFVKDFQSIGAAIA